MRQQHGFGAMITFFCNGGREEAAVFLQNVRLRMCIRGPELFQFVSFLTLLLVHLLFLSLV
jgi:cystathionine beta-lyase/cystathionine gamma-synthase